MGAQHGPLVATCLSVHHPNVHQFWNSTDSTDLSSAFSAPWVVLDVKVPTAIKMDEVNMTTSASWAGACPMA